MKQNIELQNSSKYSNYSNYSVSIELEENSVGNRITINDINDAIKLLEPLFTDNNVVKTILIIKNTTLLVE